MFPNLLDALSTQIEQSVTAMQAYVDSQLEHVSPHEILQNTALTLFVAYTSLYALRAVSDSYRFVKHQGSDGVKRKVFQAALSLPVAGGWLRNQINKDILYEKVSFVASALRAHLNHLGSGKLEAPSMSIDAIRREQQGIIHDLDEDSLARVSGHRYAFLSEEAAQYQAETSRITSFKNPLHADKKMERMYAEVLEIARDLFHGPEGDTYGVITHGGTSSIVDAVTAYRRSAEQKRSLKRNKKFNIVVPETAHWAFDKAGLGKFVEVRKCSINPETKQADLESMESLIDEDTILLVGSAPNYPYGIADDIEAIGVLGLRKNIGVHVDACLGGFYTCFMEGTKENPAPIFDFRMPGVTSISADTHKYGQAPKGSSVLLTNNEDIAKSLRWAFAGNAGGMYATPGADGSSSLARIQEILTTFKSKGRNEYKRITSGISVIRENILAKINELREHQDSIFHKIKIVGDPKLNVIAFVADDSYPLGDPINMYQVLEYMNEHKKWDLNVLQNPPGFHLCLTAVHVDSKINTCEEFVKDFAEAIEYSVKHPKSQAETKGSCGVYGAKAKISAKPIVGLFADSIFEEAAIEYTQTLYNYWPDAETLTQLCAIKIDREGLNDQQAEQLLMYEIKKIAARVVAEKDGVDVDMLLKKIQKPEFDMEDRVSAKI